MHPISTERPTVAASSGAACEDVAAGVPANPPAVLPGGLYHVVAGRLSSIDVENLSRHKPGTIQI